MQPYAETSYPATALQVYIYDEIFNFKMLFINFVEFWKNLKIVFEKKFSEIN